jgi:hypothetical protein
VKRALIILCCAGLLLTTGCRTAYSRGGGGGGSSYPKFVGYKSERRIAHDLLVRVNTERAARGLRPVRFSRSLATKAYFWSNNMAQRNSMYHSNLSTWGAKYRASAENVAWNTTPYYTAGSMHTMWMLSAGHRRNILAPNLNYIGIGVACSGGRMWGTEMFVSTTSSNFGGMPPVLPIARSDKGRVTC